uniref:NK-lysin n=1 Tax=Ctenopharyngodon idella TaxID=7959 RepID=A0A2Z2BQ80_CTEID|nr:NK-lysin [Ctenopharyngodon idella]AOT80799.1 NK-lysin [Ctenopharyngodon idella]
MLPCILLATLLISSVCAFDMEMHRGNFTEDELEQISGEMAPAQQLPGLCWACKWAMGKVKGLISRTATPSDIKRALSHVCDEIGFLKFMCRIFVNKYLGVLIEELSTTDDARTICVHVGVC